MADAKVAGVLFNLVCKHYVVRSACMVAKLFSYPTSPAEPIAGTTLTTAIGSSSGRGLGYVHQRRCCGCAQDVGHAYLRYTWDAPMVYL